MPKKLNLLRGKTDTAVDIEAALAEYDIATLETSLAAAQQRRIDLLLTGTDPEILAAEDNATKARLALDRAVAAVEELNRGSWILERQKRVRLRSRAVLTPWLPWTK